MWSLSGFERLIKQISAPKTSTGSIFEVILKILVSIICTPPYWRYAYQLLGATVFCRWLLEPGKQ